MPGLQRMMNSLLEARPTRDQPIISARSQGSVQVSPPEQPQRRTTKTVLQRGIEQGAQAPEGNRPKECEAVSDTELERIARRSSAGAASKSHGSHALGGSRIRCGHDAVGALHREHRAVGVAPSALVASSTVWFGEFQGRMQYEVEPQMPTATSHLQPSEEEPALGNYAWEGLVRIPGDPAWTDLHPDLRCDVC